MPGVAKKPDMVKISAALIQELSALPDPRKALGHLDALTTTFERRTRYQNARAGLFAVIFTLTGLLASDFLTGHQYSLVAGVIGLLIIDMVALMIILIFDHRLQTSPL